MKEKKYTREEILTAIYEKFGTLEELAKALKSNKQNISDKINRQSPKFIRQLKSAGININGAITQEYKGGSYSQQESSMHGNFIGEPKEINYGVQTNSINKLIESYDKQILFLQNQISEKDKRIKELEELTELKQKRSV